MMLNDYSTVLLCLGALLAPTALAAPPHSYSRVAPPHSYSKVAPPSTSTSAGTTAATPAPKEFTQLAKNYVAKTKASLKGGACTKEKLAVRQSWGDLKPEQRRDYTRAVNCLAKKPAKTDRSLAPGLRNRLDDFTYNHINQTNLIHSDGVLLPWHRAFITDFESALRTECQYKGYLPYWDMGMYAGNQAASPVFDGSDTSLGGDGKFVEHSSYLAPIPGLVANVSIPKFPGTGGGCVTSGPFKDLQLSLGPVSVPDSMKKDPKDVYGLKANPRCLSRDFFQPTSNANLTWTQITKLVQQPDIAGFRNYLEATMHPNGHIFIGAEGADPFSTTNDPAFYLLHAQIDRMWAIWQGQDIKNRLNALDGTTTFFGIPLLIAPTEPTRNATLDDVMDLGLKGKFTLRQGMSTTSDGRCFIYE